MKPRLLKLFTIALMALTALGSAAQEFSVGDLKYKILEFVDDSGLSGLNALCTGLSTEGEGKSNLTITIPSQVTYNGTAYRVASIYDSAFKNKTNIVGVEIRFGMAFIYNTAFYGCSNLTYVRLPSSIRSIHYNAFKECTSLKSVYYAGFSFPSAGASWDAFPSNSGMNLYIPYSSRKTPAQYKAQQGFTQFANVYYSPYAYDYYMADGGAYCIGWPDGEGPEATRNATMTAYLGTSDGLTYKPFTSTYSVGGLRFSIDTIGKNAFQGQTALETIDLTNLSNLKFFNSQDENSGIQNVTKLVLPNSNFSFNTISFLNFQSLAAFELASGSTKFSIYEGCLYNYSQTWLYKVPNAKTGQMAYPNTLTNVWDWSHAKCHKITHALLPYGVITIGAGAFASTTNLVHVRIPSSVRNLSSDRVFSGTMEYNNIYCNMANPPTVNASYYFWSTADMHLYVPYNKIQTYKNAGWTGFEEYNYDGLQAFDFPNVIPSYNTFAYTVTSTESVTGYDNKVYSGRARLVCHGVSYYDGGVMLVANVRIPAGVTIGDKNYCVNKIGEAAFCNRTSINFTVTGCQNIDTIGNFAFQNQAITSYAFTHHLKVIGHFAFERTGLTGTVALPYGVTNLGNGAFKEGKYSRLILPSSIHDIYGNFCDGTTTLTELVINKNTSNFYNNTGWTLNDVPATCRILVPTGVVNQYKQNSALSSRASYISAGAYDFAYSNNYSTGNYFLTILSTEPTTYNGTLYAGKAKYVYHPNIQTSTSSIFYLDTSEIDKTVTVDMRKYLITEIGDSTFYNSKYTGGSIPQSVTRIGQSAFRNCAYAVNNLVLPSGLTFIGHDAFYGSKITGEVKIPSSVTQIEDYAFFNQTLGSLFFNQGCTPVMGTYVWDPNIGTVWVNNQDANTFLTNTNSWSTVCGDKLAPWIKPSAATQTFSSVLPTDLEASNINAYYASAYNKNNTGKELTLTKINKAPANTGLLLTGLTPNMEYRISRPSTSVSAPTTNYLVGNPASVVDVCPQTVGYYWDASNPNNMRFVKPTEACHILAGGAYLKLSSSEASGKDEVYTTLFPKTSGGVECDVNGDGEVTGSDVTALYNYLLFNDASAVVNGDQNGDGDITGSDVTAVYNILLGLN